MAAAAQHVSIDVEDSFVPKGHAEFCWTRAYHAAVLCLAQIGRSHHNRNRKASLQLLTHYTVHIATFGSSD
eukprot:scaffold351662_cov21-Prasinocladus_malaysianus.AAC.2